MEGKTMEDFVEAFNGRVKTKPFEQFHLMMIDWKSGSARQKQALYHLLFVDAKSVEYWREYVELVVGLFPERKLQLQRVISKALELLDEKSLKDHAKYLAIHIALAHCKSTKEDAKRYFEVGIYRKQIGRGLAALYLAWAAHCQSMGLVEDAVKALQLGLDAGAEPRLALHNEWKRLQTAAAEQPTAATAATTTEELVETPKAAAATAPFLSRKLAPRGLLGGAVREAQPTSNWSATGDGDSTEERSPVAPRDAAALATPTPTPTAAPVAVLVEAEAPVSKQELKSKYLTDSLRNFRPAAKMIVRSSATATASTATAAATAARSTPNAAGGGADDCTEKMADDDVRAVVAQMGDLRAPPTPQQPSATAAAAAVSCLTSSAHKKKKRVSFSADAPPVLTAQELAAAASATSPVARSVAPTAAAPAAPPTAAVATAATATAPTAVNIFADPKRFLTLHGRAFVELSLLGKGGSSVVHRVISCDDGQLYALKRIQLASHGHGSSGSGGSGSDGGDGGGGGGSDDLDAIFASHANEIDLLKRLQGTSPYIVTLVDHALCREQHALWLLLEMGDIDLAKLLQQRLKAHAASVNNAAGSVNAAAVPYLDPLFARMVWKEMLLAVQHIHDHRIIHGDLKPANFVFVRGHLKLIDFGIAKHISNDTTNIYRDAHIGTVNYMAPEAIAPDSVIALPPPPPSPGAGVAGAGGAGAGRKKAATQRSHQYTMKLGRASDIWSLGCILYQMVYTRPPFAQLNTIQKLAAIPNAAYAIAYPPHADGDAIASMRLCLERDPRRRGRILGAGGLLQQPYVTVVHPPPAATAAAAGDPAAATATVRRTIGLLKRHALATFAPSATTAIQRWFDSVDAAAVAQRLRSASDGDSDGDEESDADAAAAAGDDDATETAPVAAPAAADDDDDDDDEATEAMAVDGDEDDATETMQQDTAAMAAASSAAAAAVASPSPLAKVAAPATRTTTPLLTRPSPATATAVVMHKRRGLAPRVLADVATTATVAAAPPSSSSSSSTVTMKKKTPATVALRPSDDKENQPTAPRPATRHHPNVLDAISGSGSGGSGLLKKMTRAERDAATDDATAATATTTTATATATATSKRRKVLDDSSSFTEQIRRQAHNLRDTQSEAAQRVTARWQRAAPTDAAEDLKSLMARKMEDMRKFMDIDADNVTATESMDLSGWIE